MGNELYLILFAAGIILGYIGYNEKRANDMLTRAVVLEKRLEDKIEADKVSRDDIKENLKRLESKIDMLIDNQLQTNNRDDNNGRS